MIDWPSDGSWKSERREEDLDLCLCIGDLLGGRGFG